MPQRGRHRASLHGRDGEALDGDRAVLCGRGGDAAGGGGEEVRLFESNDQDRSVEPMTMGESDYDFMNRCSLDPFPEHRRYIEALIHKLHNKDSETLVKRMRRNRDGWQSGLTELITLSIFVDGLGMEFEYEPRFSASAKTPDFVFKNTNSKFAVEATSLSYDVAGRKMNLAEAKLTKALNEADFPDGTVLGISSIELGEKDFSSERVVRGVTKQLDRIKQKAIASPLGFTKFSVEDSDYIIYLTYMFREEGSYSQYVNIWSGRGGWDGEQDVQIENRVKNKLKKYCDLPLPLILSVSNGSMSHPFGLKTGIERVLYGRLTTGSDARLVTGPPLGGLLDQNNDKKYQHLSGVLAIRQANVIHLRNPELRPTFYHNPYAQEQLVFENPPFDQVSFVENKFELSESSRDIGKALSLRKGWDKDVSWNS